MKLAACVTHHTQHEVAPVVTENLWNSVVCPSNQIFNSWIWFAPLSVLSPVVLVFSLVRHSLSSSELLCHTSVMWPSKLLLVSTLWQPQSTVQSVNLVAHSHKTNTQTQASLQKPTWNDNSDNYLFTLTLIVTCFCSRVAICCGNETSHESSCCLSVTWNGYGNACRTDGVTLSVNGGNEIGSGSWCENDDENGSETWGKECTQDDTHTPQMSNINLTLRAFSQKWINTDHLPGHASPPVWNNATPTRQGVRIPHMGFFIDFVTTFLLVKTGHKLRSRHMRAQCILLQLL